MSKGPKKRDPIERFMAFVIPEPNSGCLLWLGADGGDGYGRFYFDGKVRAAHIVSYTLFKGEVPSGLIVMHSCDLGFCVNPDHLNAGTYQDNMDDCVRKGRNTSGQYLAQRSSCKSGHEFVGDNLYRRSDGSRGCRACDRIRGANSNLVRDAKKRVMRAEEVA